MPSEPIPTAPTPGQPVRTTLGWSEDCAVITIVGDGGRIGRLWLDRSLVGDLLANKANVAGTWEDGNRVR